MADILMGDPRPVELQNSNGAVPVVQQSPADEELARKVFYKYKEAKNFKRNYDKDWDKWYKLYSGAHWEANRPSWKSDPVVNFIFATIETIIPIMTDSSPTITVVPTMPDDATNAEVFSQIVKRSWVSNEMQLKLPTILKNVLKYGTGFAKVWWNPKLSKGMGDVAVSVVDPRHVYPSPGAIEIDDAAYMIYAANVPLSTVERDYPNVKGLIPPGVWDEDLSINKTVTAQGGGKVALIGPIQSTDGSTVSWPAGTSPNAASYDRGRMCTIVELWSKEDDDSMRVTIMANGVLLKDEPTPFQHGEYPFIKFIDYVIPSCFWGMGDIQQLEKLQDNINKRRGQTQDILRITGNPPIIADADSGLNPKAMTTRPGTIIFKNRGTEVKWLQPPILPASLFQLQELDKQDFDSISGIYDVTQGKKPSGIEAASAITELQEAAQTRLRHKVRNMESGLYRMGRQIISLIQQFYTEERTIRLVGKNPTQPEFVTVNKEIIDENGNLVKLNDTSIGEYDLEVGVGSTMPVNKTRRYTEMMEMYSAGVVDAQAVIENSTLSPQEQMRILSRMQQQQQAMAQAQGGAVPAEGAPSGGDEAPPSEEELAQLEQGAMADETGLE
jgi:hypothetical protein